MATIAERPSTTTREGLDFAHIVYSYPKHSSAEMLD